MAEGVPRWRHGAEVIGLVGLAGVFLVNALVAFVEPSDFVDLVARSPVGGWADRVGERVVASAIGVNDLLLGLWLLLAAAARRYRHLALAWSGTWLLGVSALKLSVL